MRNLGCGCYHSDGLLAQFDRRDWGKRLEGMRMWLQDEWEAPSAVATGSPEESPTAALGATIAGQIMGTATYMVPEQARGKTVDKRADIWVFGVVLYEMLSGTRLFEGKTISGTIASVLTQEPDWGSGAIERRGMWKCWR